MVLQDHVVRLMTEQDMVTAAGEVELDLVEGADIEEAALGVAEGELEVMLGGEANHESVSAWRSEQPFYTVA